jgi:hypothetical protein
MTGVPTEIIMAALKVEEWMTANGHEKWELLGICSRNHSRKGREVAMNISELPPLPEGWKTRNDFWEVVIAPDGREFLCCYGSTLYPWKIWPADGLKPGKRYIELREPLEITTLTAYGKNL